MKAKPAGESHLGNRARVQGQPQPHSDNDFLVAAIGASAGGIEAFTELMTHLPVDTGMAFVLIQHLDPKHHSLLTDLLSKKTTMPVKEVTNGMKVAPNHVYVIPPNAAMSIANDTLRLGPREESRGLHMTIDHFMRALAEEKKNRAIGVILSGTGTDGTLGMAEIQAQGGVTFAQNDATAEYDGMPRNAVTAGCVDYVLPPEGIARELARIAQHPYVARDHRTEEAQPASMENTKLDVVFRLLRKDTGVDFTHYRKTTIVRRIQRRMVLHKLDKLEEYVKYVETTPAELSALHKDMLINVTSFFRNPRVFDALKSRVFPNILKNRGRNTSIRIWTPGCASGEETYSLGMALLETLGEGGSHVPVQLFGTDVNDSNISKARNGVYPENIRGDLSAERLRRFFSKVEGGYRISKKIRDMCIFAQHNVLNDPPFSQMDLVCCRNLLIYLEPILQGKVISLFHYAARPEGYLVLGSSEGVGTASSLFSTEDRANRIFLKKNTAVRRAVAFSLNPPVERIEYGPVRVPAKTQDSAWEYLEAQKDFDRQLLSHYSPATVFVNKDLEIVHTRGNVNRYLKLAPGRASLSILKMAREGLLLALRSAIGKARKENVTVRKRDIQIKSGDGNEESRDSVQVVNLEVVPISIGNLKEQFLMVVFQDGAADFEPRRASRKARAGRSPDSGARRMATLEQELAATKEYLQSVIETQEATNEELQSANEEILSSNEELQSTNEELETAKEELQSANEELTTVNDELRSRNLEVTQVNSDLTNALSSIDIAVVMIGRDLTVRRFTPRAQELLGLISSDIERPLLNFHPAIEIPDFQPLVLQVIGNSVSVEREIRDKAGTRYQLRILPYRTLENKTDGAVITIMEIASEKPRGKG